MASPLTVTTAGISIPAHSDRKKIFFQNTGSTEIYFLKQREGQDADDIPIPTSSNYDFILYNNRGDAFGERIEIFTTAAFRAATIQGSSILAVMETEGEFDANC